MDPVAVAHLSGSVAIDLRISRVVAVSGRQMPTPGEGSSRLQVEIEAGGVDVLSRLVSELDRHVGLVRGLVLGEADVSVRTHQGAAHIPGVGEKVRRDGVQARGEVSDEIEGGLPNRLDVTIFVPVPPGFLVVVGQLPQE